MNSKRLSKSGLARVSAPTIKRLSKYYRTLNDLIKDGAARVSSGELAKLEGFTSAQVRKDFSYFGSFGKRGSGYDTQQLQSHIAGILGLNRRWNVALVGAGNIGSALIDYQEFAAHGFFIKLVFDNDPEKIGRPIKSLVVKDISLVESECRKERIDIAILAVPAHAAQAVAEHMVKAGVKAILNFAPKRLELPREVVVRQENTAMELEALSFFIMNNERK